MSQQAAVSTNLAARSTWLVLPGRFAERSWHRRYRRAVATAFATVPYYRERWSLTTLADPTEVTEACTRAEDLVPLRGGPAVTPPARGLRETLRLAVPGLSARGTVILLTPTPSKGVDADSAGGSGGTDVAEGVPASGAVSRQDGDRAEAATRPGGDSASGSDSGSDSGSVAGPATVSGPGPQEPDSAAVPDDRSRVRRLSVTNAAATLPGSAAEHLAVAVVGTVEQLAALRAAGADLGSATPVVQHDIRTGVPDLSADTASTVPTVLHDELFGFVGASAPCGRWHLLWRQAYVRAVVGQAGRQLAFTALSQNSPRLVDITLGPAAPTRLDRCPSHGTPTVSA